MAQLVTCLTVSRCVVVLRPRGADHFAPPPVLHDWVIEGLGMYSRIKDPIKDPVPLIEKGRGLSPGGRFPPSFIHQSSSLN